MIDMTPSEIRHKMKLSQKTMAALMGMRQQNYSRLETGYEGRKLTKQHKATIRLLEFIFSNNLLSEYIRLTKH